MPKTEPAPPPRSDANYALLLANIRRYPLLTPEAEAEILRRVRAGDTRARNKLCLHNLRFILATANKYQHQGLTVGELVNEGAAGLLKAASLYEPGSAAKFMSYAVWWIRQAMTSAIQNTGRTIRLSGHHELMLRRLRRAPVRQVVGGEYVDDLAEIELIDTNEACLRQAANVACGLASLDKPQAETGSSLLDSLAVEDPETHQFLAKDEVAHRLRKLTPEERQVIGMRYGLGDSHTWALQEIGDRLGVSKERARQIEAGALRKMRSEKLDFRNRK